MVYSALLSTGTDSLSFSLSPSVLPSLPLSLYLHHQLKVPSKIPPSWHFYTTNTAPGLWNPASDRKEKRHTIALHGPCEPEAVGGGAASVPMSSTESNKACCFMYSQHPGVILVLAPSASDYVHICFSISSGFSLAFLWGCF